MSLSLTFLLLSSLFFNPPVSISTPTDTMSLLSIKNSITSDPSNLLSSWDLNKQTHHCNWYGVTCDIVSGTVLSLNITGSITSLLSGTLASEVGNLTELRILSLPYNAFHGGIPVEITRLNKLEVLELQGNRFSGWIPDDLIGFGKIRVIDLSYNQLNGRIKINFYSRCESLVELKLSSNFLTNRIPAEIGNCSNLRSILLDENILEYRIPVEIGQISELEILDLSRNSLTDTIPKEIGKCSKFSTLILTNVVDSATREEFNAFDGGIPDEVFMLPELEILWAPRANLGGRIANNMRDSCKLRVVNLGQNYLSGVMPERMGLCRNLSFLDLSSNVLIGDLPSQLQVPCMVYFNVSRNSLSGYLPRFLNTKCINSMDMYTQGSKFLGKHDIADNEVVHDFSWNRFIGDLPLFSFGDGFLVVNSKPAYTLLLNNNQLNGSLPRMLCSECKDLRSLVVNLSHNRISGGITQGLLLNCLQLTSFIAAYNRINGSISPSIGDSRMLEYLDLRGNKFSGSIPDEVGKLRYLKRILLGENNLRGAFPTQLGRLRFLTVLDLSVNNLTGTIPASLANASKLEVLLLHHNSLVGEIPSSFSALTSLTLLDVSFNNLSGRIPYLLHFKDCHGFDHNNFLQPCPDPNSSAGLPVPLEVHKWHATRNKPKVVVIALAASASVLVFILVTVLVLVFARRKLGKFTSQKKKLVVTFVQVTTELNYENVVRATGNFSVQYLIGTGGFGATYKAEVVPGFLVAVKRLSIGRFQGIQQFDAEIRTLGRIRHQNLVTLIGYHMGNTEMFLIYNYLPGGNLETFIHGSSGNNVHWSVIHKIALDIAQALAYLHESCVPRIVHRDIKPSNILLDEDHNAYLSDFGLARLLEVSETHATTDVAGTFGYVAPEYALTCRVSDKADVYSFGVVLLELLSGKRSLDPSFSNYGNGFTIVTWAVMLIKEGRAAEFFSTNLWESGPKENLLGMLRVASACTVELLSIRPSMKQVAEKLKHLKYSES